MFYKGTLKSYDAAEQVGIIHLSDKDIDLHFSLDDFPNSTLEPQIGERVKCLIEEKDFKHIAKFIVRLDHKNARTEKPRNNIFYSEDEDLDVLKKAQQEKDQVLAENETLEQTNPAIPQEFLENKQKLEQDKKLNNEKKALNEKPLNKAKSQDITKSVDFVAKAKQPNTSSNHSTDLTNSTTPVEVHETILENAEAVVERHEQELTTESKPSITQAESPIIEDSKPIESGQFSNSNELMDQQNNSTLVVADLFNHAEQVSDEFSEQKDDIDNSVNEVESVDQSKKTGNSTVLLLKPEDEIKIPQTAPLSSFTQPVDVDIKGTLDLSHPTEIKPIQYEKHADSFITPSSESIHLGHAKTIVPLSSDPFEQLQHELGSRHTTSIPEHSRLNSDNKNYAESQQSLNNVSVSESKTEYSQQQNDENTLQKVKTQLAYKTHKVKPNKKAELNFNPWILMAVISVIILAAFAYFGFQKYELHKQEQEAKARYYLLEQQKAIEDQRKKMAKLSDKPIIPEHRRKELLGETAQ